MKKLNYFKNLRQVLQCLVFLSLFALYYPSCQSIPVKSMGNAKNAIAKAQIMQAEKYANKSFKQAQKLLFESQDLVSKNKMKNAKLKAEEAERLAKKAFDISAPLLVKETKEKAEEALKEADSLFAEEFAQEDFQNGNENFSGGLSSEGNKNYLEAYQQFEEALEYANNAKVQAKNEADNMRGKLSEIEEILKQTIVYNESETNPATKQNVADLVNETKKLMNEASTHLDNLALKQAHPLIGTSYEKAQEALNIALESRAKSHYQKAKEKVGIANTKLESINIENIQDENIQNNYKGVQENLEAAKQSLNNAEEALNLKNYTDSYRESEEAIRLANIILEQIGQLEFDINKALTNVAQENEINAQDKDESKVDTTLTQSKGDWKKYTVILNVKKRDCLWRIAGYDFIYDNPKLWSKIYKANKSQIKNPDLIYPGQVLNIPPQNNEGQDPKTNIVDPVTDEDKKIGSQLQE